MNKLRNLLVRAQVRFISRRKLMRVLDENFAEAKIYTTVGRYNKILRDLGFGLEDDVKKQSSIVKPLLIVVLLIIVAYLLSRTWITPAAPGR